MSSTRSIIAPPPFAANALTVIPPTPVAGVSYRDPAAGPASSPDGWPYAERVNSAEFNQILYQATSLLSILDKKGILGWSSLVDYSEASICFGSDGQVYQWLQASGPTLGGTKDPISNPLYWRSFTSGQLIGVRVFSTSGTYTPTPGMKNVLVRAIGGGGGSGGAPATGASAVVATGGGASGSFLEAWLTAATIGASQSVVIGNGGAAGVVSGGGGAGGPTSLGILLLAPGGAGSAAGSPVLNSASSLASGGVSGGLSSGGNVTNSSGVQGLPGITVLASVIAGAGASTQFGAGGNQAASPQPGTGYGSGASGVASNPSTAAKVGAAGAPGVMIFMEFA